MATDFTDIERHNLTQIEGLNQRGGRMLSIVDLIAAGTISAEAAGYCLWRIAHGASFLTGAVPGGAGKTTLLADLLAMLPPGERIVTVPDPESVAAALGDPDRRGRCYLCHEIGAGRWYGYLWGQTVGRFFGLINNGGRVAACLHADDPVQMRDILLSPTLGVSPVAFAGVGLLLFMALHRPDGRTARRVSSIWSAAAQGLHELVFDYNARSDALQPTGRALPDDRLGRPTLEHCQAFLRALPSTGPRLFEEVRQATVAFYAGAA